MTVSLINKMLKDLETRAPRAAGKATVKPIFSDLQPADTHGRTSRRGPVLGITAILAVVAGAVLWWLWPAAPPVTAVAFEPPPRAAQPSAPATERTPAPAPAPALQPAVMPPSQGAPVAKPGEPKPAKPAARVAAPAPPAEMSEAGDELAAARIEKRAIPLSAADKAENAYRDALRLLNERRRADAEAALRTALSEDARHEKARELLVGLQLEQGRSGEALALLEAGVAASPQRPMSYQYLARLHIERGAEAEALALMEGAPPAVRQDSDVAALLAAVYQRGGRHTDAIRAFQAALGTRPREGRWWVGLAISLEAQQQWPAARDAYERARAANLDPRLREYSEQRLAILRNR